MYKEDKLKYLAKTLSRTRRKDYENYVINAVWNRVDNKNLYPISQQYVRNDDGTYYLIDLYFPQLNIGIEVDEAHHENQQEEDRIREMNIFDMLSLISKSDYEAIHIDTTKTFDEVERQIDCAVGAIRTRIREYETKRPLIFSGKEPKDYTVETVIRVQDLASFSTITETANTILGKNYKAQQKSFFKIKDNYMAWFPRLDVKPDHNSGWENSISPDGLYIHEKSKKNKSIELDEETTRVVFVQTKSITGKRIYRFVGLFKQRRKVVEDTFEYERVSTEFEIIHNKEACNN